MSQRTYRKNIRAWYAQSSTDERVDGLTWYAKGRNIVQTLADTYGLEDEAVAHVIAALSPRNKWGRNLLDARAYLEAFSSGATMPSAATFRSNQLAAWNVLTSNAPATGRKVSAFAANLAGDDDAVTVDTWAVRAATGGRVDAVQNLGQYREVARAYQAVARELHLAPCDLQAIVWVTIRNAS